MARPVTLLRIGPDGSGGELFNVLALASNMRRLHVALLSIGLKLHHEPTDTSTVVA